MLQYSGVEREKTLAVNHEGGVASAVIALWRKTYVCKIWAVERGLVVWISWEEPL